MVMTGRGCAPKRRIYKHFQMLAQITPISVCHRNRELNSVEQGIN